VNFFAAVLRFWSYLFAFAVGLSAFAVGFVLLISGSANFRLDMLPWFKEGAALWALLVLGLLGIVSSVLAIKGRAKPLLAVFCTLALVLMAYGYFLNPIYRFDGSADAWGTFAATLGALGATFGALMALKKQRA
jgi:uncharacterized membrane protein HdeD (DUF308 family)